MVPWLRPLLLWALLLAAPLCASVPPALSEIDQLYQQRSTREKAIAALEGYRQLSEAAPSTVGWWRLSMACEFVAYRHTPERSDRERLYAEGRDAGRKSLENNDHCAPCHFWTAINMALYGDTVGPFRTILTLKEVRQHLERVADIDPDYAGAGAFRILGLIEWKLPGILGGDNDRAKRYLRKGIARLPLEPLNYLFLAEILLATEGPAAAEALIKEARALPPPPAQPVESWDAWNDLQNWPTHRPH